MVRKLLYIAKTARVQGHTIGLYYIIRLIKRNFIKSVLAWYDNQLKSKDFRYEPKRVQARKRIVIHYGQEKKIKSIVSLDTTFI